MKITIHEQNDEHIKFTLTGITVAYANALRRILLSEVPTIAIDLVEIIKNNTVLPDEVLALSLGLIPMYSKKQLVYKEECDCSDLCPQCAVEMEIDVSNTTDTPLNVTCKDIRCEDDDTFIKSTPVIAKLGKNQSLKVKCIARKGTGKMHSKWSPVTVVGFEYDRTNKTRSTNYWIEESLQNDWPMVEEEEADLLCDIDTVHMDVEVVEGSLKPVDVLIKGLEILKNKFYNLRNKLENNY
ncbi:DNA-directed RNA polymerase II subunit RPB3 [Nosema granulosis]|uniref:DNA-directed RNA polymerase II subunit RPB3 n=1 Tax=Nosema granulosis TaxID=83296 RepID=A0A9P6H2V0_9MICR|nr:DNA-directed RNA polymerase II subunit RPB3 [Nosema granulosis]